MDNKLYREDSAPTMAAEPRTEFGTSPRVTQNQFIQSSSLENYSGDYRMVPISDVLEHGMTLEESERRLTEKIHRHFHPEV